MSTIRIACVPNITFAKDLEKDLYCQCLNVIIRQLNGLRKDLHFYLLLPQPVSYLSELPNVTTLKCWVPTHAPTMRVNFSATRIKTLFGKHLDIDLVWSHQPEITHALSVALETQTHHRPRIFGYAHWFDFDVVAKWPGSFRENISGLFEMDRCYINTKARAARRHAERKLASLRSADQLSRFIDFEVTRLGTTVTDRTRELLAHPHIEDLQGAVPTYRWRSRANKVRQGVSSGGA
jgi:hypothetical protein